MPRRSPGRLRCESSRRSRRSRRPAAAAPFGESPALASEPAGGQAHRDVLTPAEPYEAWGPLAVLLHGPLPGTRQALMYVRCTQLLRASRLGFWARLRHLLAERGLTVSTAVLVHLFPDGPGVETGAVLSDGGRVHEFDLAYDRMREDGDRGAVIVRWRDITGHWQARPLRSEIADAFVWRPPALRTHLGPAEEATRSG
ncbi:hypothetical protein AB0N09_15305 [Streptomyces erythrochromogenes]|uniref:hypothetical protein n=1 Tax=Streptomyces erythrochromogenes TaxID=285574 RepID=UPI00343452CE